MHSWPDASRLFLVVAALAVGALGIAAEVERYAWSETQAWVPDLLVGWTLAGLGLAAAILGRPRGSALLLVLAGLTWFTGNFFAVEPDWLGALAARVSWVFLAPLIHLSLAYPTGRPRTFLATVGVVGAWLAAAVSALDLSDEALRTATLAILTVIGCAVLVTAAGHARRDAVWGMVALTVLLVTVITAPRLEPAGIWDPTAIALDIGVVLAGVWLFAGLPSGAMLANRVLELDESAGTVEDALAALLDDPTLRVGYAVYRSGRFLGDDGEEVVGLPGQRVTEIAGVAGAVAIVVHDPSVLAHEDERRWVSVAVALAAQRAQLREQVRERADEIARSSRRLIRAEDDARTRISARMASGPASALAESARLVEASRFSLNDEGLDSVLARTAEQLGHARAELAAFAAGLGIPALDAGLAPSLAGMVAGLPLSVHLRVDEGEYPADLATTIWFVCAEGVANVLKHADASHLLIEVKREPSGVYVLVEDDGRGGADSAGSGIAGLRDRVAVLGGRLRVASEARGGTALVAELPEASAE